MKGDLNDDEYWDNWDPVQECYNDLLKDVGRQWSHANRGGQDPNDFVILPKHYREAWERLRALDSDALVKAITKQATEAKTERLERVTEQEAAKRQQRETAMRQRAHERGITTKQDLIEQAQTEQQAEGLR